MNHVNRNTYTPQKNFKVFNIPDLLKSLNVWNPKAGGKQGGGGPGGEGRRGTYRFLFLYPTMLSWTPWVPGRPLLPPLQGKKVKPACPGTQPSDSTSLTLKETVPKKEKIKFAKAVLPVAPLCLTDFCLFP